ncbi:MAG: DUF445 family protein, partial [Nocardioides sp.]
NDPDTQSRTEALKDRLLDHPQVVTTAISLWKAMRAALLGSIRDREGAVRRRLLEELNLFAGRLQEDIIRERLAVAAVSERIGQWLADPENARRVVREVADVASIGLGKVRDEHIADLVTEAFVPRFREEPIAPLLGSMLTELVRDDLHHGLVDLALEEMHRWLVHNGDTFVEVLGERAPWWAPDRLNDAVTRRLYREVVEWLLDIRHNPHHHARQALDSMLRQLAHDLLNDPDTQSRTEALKDRLLDHPQVLTSSVDLWNALRKALQTSLADPEGAVRQRVLTELSAFASRLVSEEDLRRRLDLMAAEAAVFAVSRYGAEVTAVITSTIERWDGKEAARRIELHVGRDLQFIRINGTIVGGLVGVLIHAASLVL